ncbi:MAG: DUF1990 family protein [Rubricoccaceae bacterium]|nr:DUF1990 family protein [Rubricoccaceae bacterium]
MSEWRIGRGWTDAELRERLAQAARLPRNFAEAPEALPEAPGWRRYYSEAVVGREAPGPARPDGPFARGCVAVASYAFSDPRIVIGHFDPEAPLLGRPMLLEMRALRAVRFLGPVVVGAVREATVDGTDDETVYGFRYDTLDGHIERGAEWFTLTKAHRTGDLRFRIEAYWQPGQFPTWWSRLGFATLGPRYQKVWHHRAHALLARLVREPAVRAPDGTDGAVVHASPAVVFERFPPRDLPTP